MARYTELLENPRRRRKSGRRRRRVANPVRRKRARTRTRRAKAKAARKIGRRGRKVARGLGSIGGGVTSTLMTGGALWLGKFGGELIDAQLAKSLQFYGNARIGYRKIGLGIALPLITRMLPIGGRFKQLVTLAGAFNIVAGLDAMTLEMRDNVRNSLGLPYTLNVGIGPEAGGMGDYVTDAGVGEYGLLDYQGDEYIDGVADYVTDAGY
jgi:hypothetical protein